MSNSCKWVLNLHKRFPKSLGPPSIVKDKDSKSFIITYPILKLSSKRELWFLTLQVFRKNGKRFVTIKFWSNRDVEGKRVKSSALGKLFVKAQTFICVPDKQMSKFLRKIKNGTLTADDLKELLYSMFGSPKRLTPQQQAKLDKAINKTICAISEAPQI